jgi:superfamily II DNA or RNA helicase
VSLERKRSRISEKYQYADHFRLAIVSIEPIGVDECQCIAVDHSEHLYVTDDFVVTHNTITTAALSKLCEPYGRTIVIVPNKDLVEQTEADFKVIGRDVGVFYGDRKEVGRTHTICTWQSLNVLDKKTKDWKLARGQQDLTDLEIATFLDGVVTVIVDEVHQAKSDVLKRLLTGPMAHIPLRWGLTGTIPKDDYDFFALLAAIGPNVGSVTAKELQDKGFLAGCTIDILQLIEPINFSGTQYQDEIRYLTSDETRLKFIAGLIQKMADGGNTLVLVDRLDAGKALMRYLPGSVFVSGSMTTKNRKTQYQEINVANEKIVIATYGVAAVGLNIPRIFNLVLIEPGKSFVRTIQSIGRGLRKAKDKDDVAIFDICATTRSSDKHMKERKRYYKKAQYEHTVHKIDYLQMV